MKVKDGVRTLERARDIARNITKKYFPRSNDEGRRRVMLALMRCVYEGDQDFEYAEKLFGKCVKAVDKVFNFKSDDIGRRIISLALFNNQWMLENRIYPHRAAQKPYPNEELET